MSNSKRILCSFDEFRIIYLTLIRQIISVNVCSIAVQKCESLRSRDPKRVTASIYEGLIVDPGCELSK